MFARKGSLPLPPKLDESGAVLIETAIVLTLLAPLLLFVASFGVAFYEWSEVNRLVEAGALFVSKNADVLNAMDPFDSTPITNAVGADAFGDPLTITSGCSCPVTTTGGMSTLTPFLTGGTKCDQTARCNGNTTPMAPYVRLHAEHPHLFPTGAWNISQVSADAIIRLQ